MTEHTHEWSALWDHFGPYGDQDAHFRVCLTENEHPAPGYRPDDCRAMLVGAGRSCVDGCSHEIRERRERIRHG